MTTRDPDIGSDYTNDLAERILLTLTCLTVAAALVALAGGWPL